MLKINVSMTCPIIASQVLRINSVPGLFVTISRWTCTTPLCMLYVFVRVTQTPMNTKTYKVHLKDAYREITAKPFTGLDYLLCLLAYILIAIAWNPGLAAMFLRR